MSGRVVTIGNAMVDVIATVPHPPERGGDVLASRGRVEVGGGGFRAVVAAQGAGTRTVYAGRVGTGVFGDLVRATLAELGIPAPLPPVADSDTGFVLTTVEPDGERTFITVPGAESAEPGLGSFDLEPADHLHVHGYGLVDAVRAAEVVAFVEQLPPAVVVLFDPGPFGADAEPALLARLLTRADWWSGNAAEARAATGLGDPGDAGRLLAGAVRRGAIVRRGAAGCLLALRSRPPMAVPAEQVVAVDTTGAGDTHVGIFLAALAQDEDPVTATWRANEAAARFVSAPRWGPHCGGVQAEAGTWVYSRVAR